MKVGKELTIEYLDNLKDGQIVYIEYLDKSEFVEDCIGVKYLNTYNSEKNKFIDSENYTECLESIRYYLNNGQIKVYECIPTTNYERIKNMTIEEMAEDRIYWKEYNDTLNGIQIRWYGDYYSGLKGDIKKEEAIKKEIAWLKKEVE